MTSHHDFKGRSLDDLLGLDPEPLFSPEARAKLLRGLADARVDAALDADVVVPPVGLAERTIRRVRGERAPVARGQRAPRRRLVAIPLMAAAAALAIWTFRGAEGPTENGRATAEATIAKTAGAKSMAAENGASEPVSDELLASLTVLENLEFLTEELDPLEADALFLLSMDDQVLLDLLDAEPSSSEEGF
ncbi:hypothetical protein Poly30_04600 [Planctomycetes bacterium Poly30]|uniref:Uncharacterized protein n=1 Tax=Saltatorellus ferox TaxID=2528018 RepID=A0A518ELJ7_9BACT|nr:hypothetical protein Poly30_04600 [Planctomycetes bacterium Poly30]